MAKLSLIEQLDQAIEAIIANSEPAIVGLDAEVIPLVRIATQLRDLPRESFKDELRKDLQRMTAPTQATNVAPVRPGFRTVTPYVAVADPHAVIDFVKEAFGAEGQIYGTGSEGGIHSEYRIGDSMIMIGGGESRRGQENLGAFHLYVEDVDTVYRRAVDAGGTGMYQPADHEYGERGAAVKDPAGNHWYLATALGPTYIPEGVTNLMAYLHPYGATSLIDFLKEAFGAEEIAIHKSPAGVVQHGEMRLGNSVIEMGEAHGEWQPMPMMFMLYVDDVDAWYQRAARAPGAIPISEPSDQPYGDRVGAVKDPFDNIWYMATHIRDVAGKE